MEEINEKEKEYNNTNSIKDIKDNKDNINSLLINKRSSSLLEYILKHRKDVLEKIEIQKNRYIITGEMGTMTDNIEKIEDIKDKNEKQYYKSICWYFVYILYGFIGGIFINFLTNDSIFRYDMFFNILLSPVIYYHSPKDILTNITTRDFLFYYSIPFILGLCFRFLDNIPILQTFILNPKFIDTPVEIGLTILFLFSIFILSVYYLFISTYPLMNTLLLLLQFSMIFIFNYIFYKNGGNIHFHHYFVGIIIMLLSRNYYSKLVIIIHSLSYGIFIEGISRWGFDKIFWY